MSTEQCPTLSQKCGKLLTVTPASFQCLIPQVTKIRSLDALTLMGTEVKNVNVIGPLSEVPGDLAQSILSIT